MHKSSKTEIICHVTFCPWRRRSVLGETTIATRLATIIASVSAEHNVEIIALSIQSDHVHLLAKFPPSLSLGSYMQGVKGRSSRLLRQEFMALLSMPRLWSASYYAKSVSSATLKQTIKYINNQ